MSEELQEVTVRLNEEMSTIIVELLTANLMAVSGDPVSGMQVHQLGLLRLRKLNPDFHVNFLEAVKALHTPFCKDEHGQDSGHMEFQELDDGEIDAGFFSEVPLIGENLERGPGMYL